MPKHLILPLVAGLLAAGLFLIVFGLQLGLLFMFLPSLPLFYIGLGDDLKHALLSAGVAAVSVAAASGLPAAVLFLLFIGLPTAYIARESLKWQPLTDGRRWFPIGLIFAELALYATALLALIVAFYASEPGGLPKLLAQNIREAFTGMENTYGPAIAMLAGPLSFLVLSVAVWMWGLMLFVHACLANTLLNKQGKALRPRFAIEPFTMPQWMLALLFICALATFIGSDSMRFLGKCALVSLMLPYFLLGAGLMHQASRAWPNRRFFLGLVYVATFTQFWPALFIAGIGFFYQIKHLSGGAISFKD